MTASTSSTLNDRWVILNGVPRKLDSFKTNLKYWFEYQWLKFRLKRQGVRRIEFHTFGNGPGLLRDKVMILRAIVNDECTPVEPFGDSYGLKPREISPE